jgi:hypothetical protein
MGRERFEAPEALFTPSLVDEETPGMAELLFKTIQSADIDLRAEFYKHIVLSGGSSMYPGLPSRLEKDIKVRESELRQLRNAYASPKNLYLRDVLKGNVEGLKKFQIRIEDPPRRKHMVFLGGAVLADIMRDKEEFWMTRKEYNEIGKPRICHLTSSHFVLSLRQGRLEEARLNAATSKKTNIEKARGGVRDTLAFFCLVVPFVRGGGVSSAAASARGETCFLT